MQTETQLKTDPHIKEGQVLVEVWEDVVDVKQLMLSLLISAIGSLGGYLIAPNVKPYPLMFGLLGSLAAFIVCSVLFKPKRILVDEEV